MDGRKRMDVLLNPPASLDAEERVLNTMELGEDIRWIFKYKFSSE